MRSDLIVRRHRYQGQSYWVIKDPCALRYFRLLDQEHAVLEMLDGQASLDDLKARFERRFPTHSTSTGDLQRYIATLHENCLAVVEAAGQGQKLQERAAAQRRRKLLGSTLNLLSFRFRGFDPRGLLDVLYPRVRWAFHPFVVACVLLGAVTAAGFVLGQFDEFRARLPHLEEFFTPYSIFWLIASLGAVRVLHEFGHALACRHFGAECHEMGVMLLLLTPCLYCNVSDAAMLPQKWQRAAIGAAGMYVELALASLATLLWWNTEPGPLHQIALSTMVVCSISTLAFNANPLMRFDGYYIASDLWEVPGLARRGRDALVGGLLELLVGYQPPRKRLVPERRPLLLASFGLASLAYRFAMLGSLAWVCYRMAKPQGLQNLVVLAALVMAGGMVAPAARRGVKFWLAPGRWKTLDPDRLVVTGIAATIVLLVALLVPWPYEIVCPAEIQAEGAEAVVVSVPGSLVETYVQPGQAVVAGQPLARLANTELEMQHAEVARQYESATLRLSTLERQRGEGNAEAALALGAIHEEQQRLWQDLEQKTAERQRLLLLAPLDGVVFSAPNRPAGQDSHDTLPEWSGAPLDPKNRGCRLRPGDVLCQVGPAERFEAVLAVDQTVVDFVLPGAAVDVRLDAAPGTALFGQISQLSRGELETSSAAMSARHGGDLATHAADNGQETPWLTHFQASAPLETHDPLLRPGLRGAARVQAGYQTLAQRLVRAAQRTFRVGS
jgi:putative peptide zinc metalloprotease protein